MSNVTAHGVVLNDEAEGMLRHALVIAKEKYQRNAADMRGLGTVHGNRLAEQFDRQVEDAQKLIDWLYGPDLETGEDLGASNGTA